MLVTLSCAASTRERDECLCSPLVSGPEKLVSIILEKHLSEEEVFPLLTDSPVVHLPVPPSFVSFSSGFLSLCWYLSVNV